MEFPTTNIVWKHSSILATTRIAKLYSKYGRLLRLTLIPKYLEQFSLKNKNTTYQSLNNGIKSENRPREGDNTSYLPEKLEESNDFKQNRHLNNKSNGSSIKRLSEELSSVISVRVGTVVMVITIIIPFLSYSYNDYSGDVSMTMIDLCDPISCVLMLFMIYVGLAVIKYGSLVTS